MIWFEEFYFQHLNKWTQIHRILKSWFVEWKTGQFPYSNPSQLQPDFGRFIKSLIERFSWFQDVPHYISSFAVLVVQLVIFYLFLSIDMRKEVSCFYFVSQKYPEYYQVIKNPIDLKMIATKIQDGKYSKLDDLERDLNLMIRNAQTYNEPKSIIFKVGCLCVWLYYLNVRKSNFVCFFFFGKCYLSRVMNWIFGLSIEGKWSYFCKLWHWVVQVEMRIFQIIFIIKKMSRIFCIF